jgi:hypothetical protein
MSTDEVLGDGPILDGSPPGCDREALGQERL